MTAAVPIGRLEDCAAVLQRHGTRPILLVADRIAFESSGAAERLGDALRHRRVQMFCDFQPNPQLPDVLRGVRQLRGQPESLILAVGGGTAIDVAKLIGGLGAQDERQIDSDALEIVRAGSLARSRVNPFIAIPTTAGTGSEATQFAVVYADGQKSSVSDASLIPDDVILDPTLTISLPRHITMATGLDALTQAIESLWSVQATEESQGWAEDALRLGLKHLELVANEPTLADREAMMKAAHLAGRAINVSKTTAPHALSYTMTSRHGVPHGMAVAISLSTFMRFNAGTDASNATNPDNIAALHRAFQRIVQAFGIHAGVESGMNMAAEAWDELLQRVACPRRLHEWDITQQEDFESLVRGVNLQRLANNPRRITEEELREIVRRIR